jgi:hypothetical protein
MNEIRMMYDGDESYDNAATRLRSLFWFYCTTRAGQPARTFPAKSRAKQYKDAPAEDPA